ncbi:hypothetical protein CTKZ_14910 [Cellulomonas algicola]|uniref:Uncharacterized protein n=1 Tax=Cellulomonas algicola TaxID=2071633 RepID=A0A401UZ14_9CELL|nr:hypothetical protein [Cellulomonas algicola]GCD19929.1 hypothetical protein CTKZ_14910 [Cellulomonas algicola]
MTTETTEYARFGPWVDEVTTPDDVPRLYRDHPLDLTSTRLVLKVPRNIARRDAHPGMDLYDHLLVLDDARLTVLSRTVTTSRRGAPALTRPYDVREIALRDVAAVHDVVSMLDASLTLHPRTGRPLTVRYNGSSRQTVDRLVDALRDSFRAAPAGSVGRRLLDAADLTAAPPQDVRLGGDDTALRADVLAVARRHAQLRAWAWHERRVVHRYGRGLRAAAHRLTHAVSPMTLHGAVVAGDDRALEVVGRRAWLVRGRTPEHSASRLVVGLATIDTVTAQPHPAYQDTATVTIRAGDCALAADLPERSAAHVLLSGVADRHPAVR